MEIVAGLFIFLALIGWMLMVMNGLELTVNQLTVWVPVTPVGKFVRWSIRRLGAKAFMIVQGFVMVLILAGFGGLVTGVSWAFGLLAMGLVVVEILEILREFDVMRKIQS